MKFATVKLWVLVETVTLTVFHKHNFIVNYDKAYSLNFLLKMYYMYMDTWQCQCIVYSVTLYFCPILFLPSYTIRLLCFILDLPKHVFFSVQTNQNENLPGLEFSHWGWGQKRGKIKQKPIFPYIHCLSASDVGLLTLIFRAGQPGYQQ